MSNYTNPEAEIQSLLTDLWKRHLPSMHERLNLLDHAALSAESDHLEETERAEAQSVAHKLAGNLGMFGHNQAGTLASEIEHILKAPTPEKLHSLPGLAKQLRASLEPHL